MKRKGEFLFIFSLIFVFIISYPGLSRLAETAGRKTGSQLGSSYKPQPVELNSVGIDSDLTIPTSIDELMDYFMNLDVFNNLKNLWDENRSKWREQIDNFKNRIDNDTE